MLLVPVVLALAACGGPAAEPSTPSAPTATAPVTAEVARAVPGAEPTQAPSPTPTTAPPAAPATSSPAPTATAESTATAAAAPSPTSTPTAAPAPTETPRPAATPEPEPGEEDRSSVLKVITVLPFDAIPAILDPSFVTGDDAREQYSSDEMVLGLSIGDDRRAYSIPYLSSREIVNDVVGGVPVAVTW